jgi:hypothetical protein
MNRKLEFPTIMNLVRENFETQERQTRFISYWNTTSLREVKRRHQEKTMLECFNIIYKELHKCQLTIDKDQQTEAFLKRRLLIACEGVDECKLAIFKPALSLQGLRDDIRHALALSDPHQPNAFRTPDPGSQSLQGDTNVFLTDRRYYDNRKKHPG